MQDEAGEDGGDGVEAIGNGSNDAEVPAATF
jgi:hypothetical protein